MTPEQLVREALEAMHFAYVPYSGFTVGAALLTKSGKIYRGCNIENAAYGPSNCAERTAIFKAVSEGEREFAAIAVVGGKNGDASDIFPPCGVCRQVMQEFCAPDFMIYMGRSDGSYVAESLGAMLPCRSSTAGCPASSKSSGRTTASSSRPTTAATPATASIPTTRASISP